MLGIAQLINEASVFESNNEHEVALRLYKTAFNNLLDINRQVSNVALPGVSPFEVRSIGDFLNHKTCEIQFMLNHPRDAITQFKKFIDTFKQHTNSPEYSFENAAWLSQQYMMFADQFDNAVLQGTKANRSQHPGMYYFEAALQYVERRKNVTEYTNDNIRSNQMPVTNELLAMITTQNFASFLRQCGWTCIDPDVGPPVAPIEMTQPKIQSAEPVQYAKTIIAALIKASEYFSEWKRARMLNCVNIMIASEYDADLDKEKARKHYNLSMAAYSREHWTPLVEYIKARLMLLGDTSDVKAE